MSEGFDLKRGMNRWVSENTTLSEFAADMGYKYPNAWGLLRGKVPVTVETVGRFVLAYGPLAAGEMLQLAGLTDEMEVKFEGGRPVAAPLGLDTGPKSGPVSTTNGNEPVYTRPVEVA